MAMYSTLQVNLISDLKDTPVSPTTQVLVTGKTAVGDGLGGFYRWDDAATGAEDASFSNIIVSNLSTTGRWVRIFQKVKILPQGVLVFNGGVRTLYAPAVISSNSDAKLFLTDDNTATGVKLFKEIWKNDSRAQTTASTSSNGVSTYIKETPDDTGLVSTTHGYFKANPLTITLGLVYNPFTAAPAGTKTLFEIVGVYPHPATLAIPDALLRRDRARNQRRTARCIISAIETRAGRVGSVPERG